MPRFTAYRVKEYVADVEAATIGLAAMLAEDVPGVRWQLLNDRVDSVAGLDGAKVKVLSIEDNE